MGLIRKEKQATDHDDSEEQRIRYKILSFEFMTFLFTNCIFVVKTTQQAKKENECLLLITTYY